MTDNDDVTRTEGEGATLDMPEGLGGIAPGQVLGERYQVLEMLGRGGMGEVWHAFDLKLRVEVALKALREDLFKSERRLEMLRDEVRAAREVVSPNVCRIFDLIEIEARELVSMEYVDGATLLGVLQERGPLELKEAQDIASQFLAGLEAIHKAGLIHRDIKPENIMLTRAGRVVVMDFGLARQEAEGGGSVSGTPAYMAPEQAAGQTLDARADVYAAGVVLAEMVSPDGLKDITSRQSVWEAVRSEPAQVPDSPWAQVIQKAVRKDREQRYNSAHTLTRALEDVTLRVEGAEDLHPYPGLASFTEADAEYFFGREAEVEQMWRKLEGPPRLFAIMGPSGAGKTSFIRAGLIPYASSGWSIIRSTPGDSAVASLAAVVARETAGDPDVVELLPRFDHPDIAVRVLGAWAGKNSHSLVVVDQFEELFTQNPPEEQRRFADLLRRFVLEADVHVLLSMRDDFAAACNAFESLRPIFHEMTVLDPPAGAALRRALTQPALQCGYRFEDDELVDEMLGEVEGERGALPLLAFAAARLWEKRDRETGLLTRQAYEDIGGVGGALARHAEATIDRIGHQHLPTVRELFRNLVTAEGTRAVREWNELLSVFCDSSDESPEEVLRQLIDARLLTSYEVREADEGPTRRVEIIHESLLANWPRLVRWQTQDADAAQLRDQLRQAAKTWDDHGRTDDTLWTGAAYREFASWRERYPGGLTETEHHFADAMTSLATRRKRRRRVALTAGVTALILVLAVVTGLWRRATLETRRAVAAANRAEASKLVTLGELALDDERTRGLAYAIASLDRADTPEGRRLALKALWEGPPATVMRERQGAWALAFAPDGGHLAVGHQGGVIRAHPRAGNEPQFFQAYEKGRGFLVFMSYSPDSANLVGSAAAAGGEVRVWDSTNWKLVRSLQAIPQPGMNLVGIDVAHGFVEDGLNSILTVGFQVSKAGQSAVAGEIQGHWLVRRWFEEAGSPELLGEVVGTMGPTAFPDLTRGLLAVGQQNELRLYRLETAGQDPPRVVGRYPTVFTLGSIPAFDPIAERLALCDADGNLLVWPLAGNGKEPERAFKTSSDANWTAFSPDGVRLAHATRENNAWLWNLRDPAGTAPIQLDRTAGQTNQLAFSPEGKWLATSGGSLGLALWPLTNPYVRILEGHEGGVLHTVFAPDGLTLYTHGRTDGTILSWDLDGTAGENPKVLLRDPGIQNGHLELDPRMRFLLISGGQSGGVVWKVPLDGAEPSTFEPFDWHPSGFKIDPTGRYLATSDYLQDYSPIMIVYDIDTGKTTQFEPPGEGNVNNWNFDPDGRLLIVKGGTLSRWDMASGNSEILLDRGVGFAKTESDGRHLILVVGGVLAIMDLENGSRVDLPAAHQGRPFNIDIANSMIVSGGTDGEIRVGPISGDSYHVLVGHDGPVFDVDFSPDGKWVVSFGEDRTLRLWPVPDLSRPSLNALPHEELMAKLYALTNLRAVRDEERSTGYRLTIDFDSYRGWDVVPEW